MAATVLLIDDDGEVVRTYTQWLAADGYDVRSAGDGEAALAEVPGAEAILVDLRMPILDGLGFVRRLRSRGDRAAVAIVTGDYLIDEAIVDELQRLGAQIVFKPLWLDELTALVSGLVARSSVA